MYSILIFLVTCYLRTLNPALFLAVVSQITIVFLVVVSILFILVIAVGTYVIICHSRLCRVADAQRKIKLLEVQMNGAILGVMVGILFISGAFLIFETPWYLWGTMLPDSIMPLVDLFYNPIVLIFLPFAGFCLFVGWLIVAADYSSKLQKLKKEVKKK